MNDTELLELAHQAVIWANQCRQGIEGCAGSQWFFKALDEYAKARVEYFAEQRPLTLRDTFPSTYRLAAEMQPWNHRIAWNCPTYWDGCNCPGGPYTDRMVTDGPEA